jgi:hypothetical protein|tara:strand:- start:3862 stop:4215 length:354 start_codon:yes stop_codon:yes gene_type:complete
MAIIKGDRWARPIQSDISQVTREESGTTYTFLDSDHGTKIEFSNAGAITASLNTGLRSDFSCVYEPTGGGTVTISGTATLNIADGASYTDTEKDNVVIAIIPTTTTDEFTIQGRLIP